MAGRGRSYIAGAAKPYPMPLTVGAITDVLNGHPVHLARDILDTCVFALDNIYLNEHSK